MHTELRVKSGQGVAGLAPWGAVSTVQAASVMARKAMKIRGMAILWDSELVRTTGFVAGIGITTEVVDDE